MLAKRIDITIDQGSWKRRSLPAWATSTTTSETIDVFNALLLLGAVTTPSALSPASPERFWACIRYFTACAAGPSLQIRTPFLDLDPHQKGILSDDFGVALSTYWLQSKLGGVRSIVDGRRFAINMGVRSPPGRRLSKVGMRKLPDFVLEDRHGKFHVLECKGTQSGLTHLNRAMNTGHAQKMGIKIIPALRGERLVIGVALAGEASGDRSRMVVKDPTYEPIAEIGKGDRNRAKEVMRRLSLARALNLTGFPQTAFEIAWPTTINRASPEIEFLNAAEKRILSSDRGARARLAREEIRSEFSSSPRQRDQAYVTQEIRFDLPEILLEGGSAVRAVVMRRGVRRSILETLAKPGGDVRDAADETLDQQSSDENIKFQDAGKKIRVEYGGYFFSEAEFD